MTLTPSYRFSPGIWELDLDPILENYKKWWDKEPFFKEMGMDWDPDTESLKALYDSGNLFTMVAYAGDELKGAYVGAVTPYICDKNKKHCYELMWFTNEKSKAFTDEFFKQLDKALVRNKIYSMTLAYPKPNSALMKRYGYRLTQPMYMKKV